MPLFATLVAACINGLVAIFGVMMATSEAIKWARRVFIIALMAAFCVAVKVCMSTLLGYIASFHAGGLPSRFMMGLGMLIPSNATAVLACMGSVWLACVILRLKMDGLAW